MGVLSRIGVALDSDLLERFDDFTCRSALNFLASTLENGRVWPVTRTQRSLIPIQIDVCPGQVAV